MPLEGGILVKGTIVEQGRRPFTPPFAQLVQEQQRKLETKVTPDSSNEKEKAKYVYDKQLRAYYDPASQEYFEVSK